MIAGRAVVVGGGIAGLLAARVLADHFDRVTLVDKDRFPSCSENRRGTPQDPHSHALLARGERTLSKMFPAWPPPLSRAAPLWWTWVTIFAGTIPATIRFLSRAA